MQSLPSICDKCNYSVLLRLPTGKTADCTWKWRGVTKPLLHVPLHSFHPKQMHVKMNKITCTDQSSHEKEFLDLVWQGVAWQGIECLWRLMTLFTGKELYTCSRLFKANHSQQSSSTNRKGLFQKIVTPEPTCFSSFYNQQDLILFPDCSHPTCALLSSPRWQIWSGWGLGTELLPLH